MLIHAPAPVTPADRKATLIDIRDCHPDTQKSMINRLLELSRWPEAFADLQKLDGDEFRLAAKNRAKELLG